MHEGVISDYAAKGLLVRRALFASRRNRPASFTEASRFGVTIGKHVYGLPWDTHGACITQHRAFAKAGLMRGSTGVAQFARELLAHAASSKRGPASPI